VATQIYLVDTSVWIFALRRNAPEIIRRRLGDLLDLDAVATCGLIELELLGGTRDEAEFNRLQARLSGLRRLLIEPSDWTDAARLAFDLRRLQHSLKTFGWQVSSKHSVIWPTIVGCPLAIRDHGLL
jgi:predicted nucleic acid-binding protein